MRSEPEEGGPGGRSPARPGAWGPGPQKAPWTTRRSDSEQGRPEVRKPPAAGGRSAGGSGTRLLGDQPGDHGAP